MSKAKADHYIFSTLAADVIYPVYVKGGADLPQVEQEVLIKGGANVINKRLDTPAGVVTGVTSEQLDALMRSPVFKLHLDNGHLVISQDKPDVEVVAADMTQRDNSAQLVEEDFAEGEAPKVNTDGDDDDKPAPAPLPRPKGRA